MSAFDRIIGYQREKEELYRLCDVLKQPAKYEALGVRLPSAILLYGEPGLGKTLFAKAFIEESGLPCFFCRKDRSDGDFVASITETFAKATESAPSIVLLDDMDKFAEDNLQKDSNKEEFSTIQTCMESVREKRVFVLATANDIDYLPESLMRAGRFGRQIRFHAPSASDAAEIVRHYLRGKPISKDLSPETIADILQGKSCATLEEIVNEAGILAGYENAAEISREHLIRAILQTVFCIVPSNQSSRMQRFASYHEAGHAVVALSLGQKVGILCVQSGKDMEGVCTAHPSDSYALTFHDLLENATIALAGKAAIELQFGEADAGCRNDIDEAIDMIRPAMTRNCAVGFEYGYDREGFERRQAAVRLERISEKLYNTIEMCYQNALRILKRNRDLVEAIAAELQKRSALLSDDLEQLLLDHPLKKD